jgi:predicted ATP-binding protein involved in virulence
LITTHSPLVLSQVKSDELFLLNMDEQGLSCEPASAYGKTAESVLNVLMGVENTRPKEIADMFTRIYRSISDKKISTAKQLFQQLKEKIHSDPELVRLGIILQREERNRK